MINPKLSYHDCGPAVFGVFNDKSQVSNEAVDSTKESDLQYKQEDFVQNKIFFDLDKILSESKKYNTLIKKILIRTFIFLWCCFILCSAAMIAI